MAKHYAMTYCERGDATLFAEPVNALTNLFFIMAAFGAYRLIQKNRPSFIKSAYFLTLTLFCIGLGSFFWHTVATPWAQASDVIPIVVFVIGYLFFFAHNVLDYTLLASFLSALSFLLFSALFSATVDMELFNKSIGYFPVLFYLILYAVLYNVQSHATNLYSVVFLFTISLIFRSIYMRVCETIAIGTHFLWHTLNAVVLYMLMRIYILSKT